jgi:hypothetical protein
MKDTRPPGQASLGGTLGFGAGTAFRKLRGEPGRNRRIFHGLRSGGTAFLKSVLGTLHVLFLEVSGVIFLTFTLALVGEFVHEYRKYAMHQAGLHRVILAGVVGTMFLYFGLSSFWRANRKRSRV